MTKFIETSIKGSTYNGRPIINNAVNIDLCTVIEKVFTVDNETIPTIRFYFNTTSIEWAFSNELERDNEYSLIMEGLKND